MLSVTTRARQARLRVGTAVEFRMRTGMAIETDRTLLCRCFLTKRENIAEPAPRADVLTDVAVTIETAGHLARAIAPGIRVQHPVRIRREFFKLVAMTGSTERLGHLRIQSLRPRALVRDETNA